MYMLESMIEMGLKDGQKWPSKAHRAVALNLAICNPLIKTRDDLMSVVGKVCEIPKLEIKKVKYEDLPKYGLGLCVSP